MNDAPPGAMSARLRASRTTKQDPCSTHSPKEPTMNKFAVPIAGAALLLTIGAGLSAADNAAGLVHGAAALRSVADPAAQAASGATAAPGRAPFLLSPFGHLPPHAPESLPADASVRTRSGAYVTREQADTLARELRGDVVWVDVDCCGESAIDTAQGHVAGMLAANNLADDAAVFVSGANLADAARLVDRLNEQPLTRVFLVTR
jgi:hypothetical protein